MAASAPTNLVRKKPNPTWKQGGDQQLETYQGSPMDLATSLPSLNKKALDITSLLDKDSERGVENGLIQQYFPGFSDIAYQDSVNYTSVQKFQSTEHYNKTITFYITPLNYYNLNGNLIIYMKATTAAGDKLTADTVTVDKFWKHFFTSIRVKKQNDVNTININSDDIKTNFDLYIESCKEDYITYERDLLTTNLHRSGVDASLRVAGGTNDSLTKRLALFKNRVAASGRYVIPLRALCNIFNIDVIPPESLLTIEIGVEQDAMKLFDSKTDVAIDKHRPLAMMKLEKPPEIEFQLVDQTPTHQLAFERIFIKKQSYRLWDGFSWETKLKEIPTGVTTAQIDFPPNMYQYKWLKISLQDVSTTNHPNLYCNYGYEEILSLLKSIKITGLYTSNTSDTIEYNLSEEEDLDHLYGQYMAFFHGYSYSRANSDSYRTSDIISSAVRKENFLTSNLPLYLDISQTRGLPAKPDPPNQVINPNVKITLKSGTSSALNFSVVAFYPSQYHLSVQGVGGSSEKVITFSPRVNR